MQRKTASQEKSDKGREKRAHKNLLEVRLSDFSGADVFLCRPDKGRNVMSYKAKRFQPGSRHRCSCGRPARYYSWAKRRYVYAADHQLCRQCWSSARSRLRASALRPRSLPFFGKEAGSVTFGDGVPSSVAGQSGVDSNSQGVPSDLHGPSVFALERVFREVDHERTNPNHDIG